MTFKENLARQRKARGLSQEELAAKIGVSRQAVSKWETGDAAPDLNRLLALAEALDTSLDALCGQEPAAPAPSTAAVPGAGPTSKRRWLLAALCGFLAACLLAAGLWAWTQRNMVPSESATAASNLPDAFTVTGVEFFGESDYRVSYHFTPSAAGEDYRYQITFTDADGGAATFDAPYSGGVCAGTAAFSSGYGGYQVTVSVTDGTNSRNLAIASGLCFSQGSASWTPIE